MYSLLSYPLAPHAGLGPFLITPPSTYAGWLAGWRGTHDEENEWSDDSQPGAMRLQGPTGQV